MSENIKVLHDGDSVVFRRAPIEFAQARFRYKHVDYCPLCKELLGTKCPVVILCSNHVGVPNSYLHDECFDKCTPEYAWRMIFEDWKEAQKYKHWFRRS